MVARFALLMLAFVAAPLAATAQTAGDTGVYFPDANWQHKTPAESGFNPVLLEQAVAFAVSRETKAPRDLVMNRYQTVGREPFGYAVGPIKERGAPTGLVIHHGCIVAEWGEPLRVDMTYSMSKSFLSTVIGVAFDRGMIRSIDDIVRDYVAPVLPYNPLPPGDKSERLGKPEFISLFDTPHNRTITWGHMLRQTSDWEGTLWGKPDWADRPHGDPAEWTTRPRRKSGSYYEYNDVRVNALALAALNVWRRPPPSMPQAYTNAVTRGLAGGLTFGEIHELSAKMAATIPPDQIDRMLSGKEAARMIVRLVEGRGGPEEMTGRFPRPWRIVEHAASFAVRDAMGRNIAWFHFRNDPDIVQSVALVFKDEARRRAMKFAEPLLDKSEHG